MPCSYVTPSSSNIKIFYLALQSQHVQCVYIHNMCVLHEFIYFKLISGRYV